MSDIKNTWTRAHDLALIFIALAYGTDHELHEDELATITDVLQNWRDNFPAHEVQDVVMEAVAIFTGDDPDGEVRRSVHALKEDLSVTDLQRAMEDLMRVAEADGVLLSTELDLINRLADAWEIRAASENLIAQSTATVSDADAPPWSLLHDIALIYIVLAHSSDNSISEIEIAAMVERLGDWQSQLDEEGIRQILRSALAVYSEGPDQVMLQRTLKSIRKMMPAMHLLVLLDDLLYIAQSDGTVNANEKEMLSTLSRSWGVSVRVNGSTSDD